jgi:beta-glucosidase
MSDPINIATGLAKNSDIAILFVGTYSDIETEGCDREGLQLPFRQDELVEKVSKANPNTIVVLTTGTSVKMDKWEKNVPAILDMFFGGQEGGNAITEILFGDVNPSGKLPFSFIKSEGQLPVYKGYRDKSLNANYSEGIYVGYRYLDKYKVDPQYPFGHGLSYTNFEYSDLSINKLTRTEFEVKLKVKNTGKVEGDEVVQLYVSDIECTTDRPEKELKAFSRIKLKPAEIKVVTMKLNEKAFAFYNLNKKSWTVEPGEFEILMGSSSRDIRLKNKIEIK